MLEIESFYSYLRVYPKAPADLFMQKSRNKTVGDESASTLHVVTLLAVVGIFLTLGPSFTHYWLGWQDGIF